MSRTAAHSANTERAEQHLENDHQDHDMPHGSFRGYMTGFILSIILTAIPFALVMTNALDSTTGTAIAVLSMALIQILVHMVYFLHMDRKTEGGWSMLALIFTVIFVFITLAGSMWVMYHLNTNMMPQMSSDAMSEERMSPDQMQQMP